MNKKGIALIMVVGGLAILATIATSFALNMRLEYHAAMNYYNGIRARYFAEGALQTAIAKLREHVKSSAFDYFDATNEIWATSGYSNDINAECNAGRITAKGTSVATPIVDEQRKINVNNASSGLLEDLVSVLRAKGSKSDASTPAVPASAYSALEAGDGTSIVTNRPTAPGYRNLREVMTLSLGAIDITELNLLKQFITTESYEDDKNSGRSPININTADQAVIAAVIKGIGNSSSTPANELPVVRVPTIDMAWNGAGIILTNRTTTPLTSWKIFDEEIPKACVSGSINASHAILIKYSCNPNRPKPPEPVPGSLRYTTEFCFNSGGYYTITARGTVIIKDPTNTFTIATLSTRTLTANVKIYDIYCETTKEQFELGAPVRVTWLDTCPVNSGDLFGAYAIPTGAKTIKNSIKLGFWDDFSSSAYTYNAWKKVGTTLDQFISEKWYFFDWAQYRLGQDAGTYAGYKDWANYSVSMYERDNAYNPGGGMKDVGWIFVKGMAVGDPAILHARSGKLEWGPLIGTKYAYQDPSGAPGEVIFLSDADAQAAPYFFNPATDKYTYQPQIRIFRDRNNATVENYDTDTYRSLFAYDTTDRSRKYNILVNDTDLAITVYPPSGSPGSFSVNDINSGTGAFGLYAQANNVWWDDVRLISQDGNFTSQTISSSVSPGLANTVEWGTITGTVTIPSTASSTSETVLFQTELTGGTTWDTPSSGNHIASANGNSIQYKALFATTDSEINETPVLEDVTITYLPKVSIKSFSLSN